MASPQSLREIALTAEGGVDYTTAMKEFIDRVIVDLIQKNWGEGDLSLPLDAALFQQEPPYLDDEVARVHLGGMAEYLAHLSNQRCPAWCLKECYFLGEPVFFGRQFSREFMIRETPAAFRRRLLFCGKPLLKMFVLRERMLAAKGNRGKEI